ncbi:MAG: hypothetical protein K6A23_15260 [Butyrivibrio sp.]|nr:hypothetical protein [Butyrivibrio sp.]
MKRNFTSVLAAALVGAMVIGSTVFAADSSSTSNTDSTAITYSNPTVAAGNTIYAVPSSSKKEGTATVGSTRITVNYSEVTVPGTVETAVVAPVKEEATKVLNDYVNANLNGGTVVLKTKLRLYKAGKSINSDFGVIKQAFGVGNKYDGRTATVYQIHQDGTITATDVVVTNGKVNVSLTDLGTFSIVIR